ncbi:hypothetical protein ACQFX9_16775 [Aliinostoc sp. HNIBRCY26]
MGHGAWGIGYGELSMGVKSTLSALSTQSTFQSPVPSDALSLSKCPQ